MLIEISHHVIGRLHTWNEERGNERLDRPYALALLLVLASKHDISHADIGENVLAFIQGMMRI